ncbi:hypothetical protein [Fangia hongkongensis]|uniref:hypothetical protein n=1 Tax=Fangia hongkongensis TaxID=270495 RepID=UPI00037DA3D2|nr:hypothetical protein [Fangia hongkongensis]MBK2126267.1 hypothetical protein [Fangia hongkongensis]
MVVRVYFTRRYHFSSYFIRLLSWSHFSHVEVEVDGCCYSSNGSKGVYERDTKALYHSQDMLEIWESKLDDTQKDKLIGFLKAQLGKKYDYFAALGLGLWRRDWYHNENRWFCSEIIDAAFKHAEHPLTNKYFASYRLTPNDLRTSVRLKRISIKKNIHHKSIWKKILNFFGIAS